MSAKRGGPAGKIIGIIKRHVLAFLLGLAFAVVCFIAINAAAKPFSTSQYCGSKCHEMGDAYKSWELSAHYANDNGVVAECIDCHLPPKDKFFTHMAAKAYEGAKDIYKHHFGGEYERQKVRKEVLDEMPNIRCLTCHSNLLTRPASSAARIAHQEMLNPTEDFQARCVECHESLHEREKKIFSPD
ncbi:MAG: cytochrome c3 family protein [Planctomycetota bacterium]|jgi:nitrate/TMAO reductase-like tetraheme cytochrome c subunit